MTFLSKILFYTCTISAYILKIIIVHKYDGSIRSDSTAQCLNSCAWRAPTTCLRTRSGRFMSRAQTFDRACAQFPDKRARDIELALRLFGVNECTLLVVQKQTFLDLDLSVMPGRRKPTRRSIQLARAREVRSLVVCQWKSVLFAR